MSGPNTVWSLPQKHTYGERTDVILDWGKQSKKLKELLDQSEYRPSSVQVSNARRQELGDSLVGQVLEE